MADPRCELTIFPSAAEVAESAAVLFVEVAERAIRERGSVGVALSGGSTPERLFALLAAEPWSSQVEWEAVHLFWGDERSVPPDHPDSNYGLAYRSWLKEGPVPASQIHRIRGEIDPREAALEYEAQLREFVEAHGRRGRGLDLVFLGMGADGHTASLFPGSDAFRDELEAERRAELAAEGSAEQEAEGSAEPRRWVVENYLPELDAWRVTFTLVPINRAAHVAFLVIGSSKAGAVRRVLSSSLEGSDILGVPRPTSGGSGEPLPAALVRPSPGRRLWLVDEAAAFELGNPGPICSV